MRRSMGFDGRGAAFDSHSCFARHQSDVDFVEASPRWIRRLHGHVNPQIWASAHENFHWAQHIATGFGSFLNRLRSERDRYILLAIKAMPESGRLVEDRISAKICTSLFNYDAILANIRKSRNPDEFIEWAVGLDFLERSIYFEDCAKHWRDDVELLGRVAGRLLNGGDNPQIDYRSFAEIHIAWPTFYEPISTEQLMEAQAVLFENFYLDNFAHPISEKFERYLEIEGTHYYAPIHYAARELYRASTDAEFISAIQGTGARAFWITVFACIDLSLDIFFPAPQSLSHTTPVDWCPPLRFRDLIESVKSIGPFPFEAIADQWTNSRQIFLEYRERLKSEAGLRSSTDHDFVPIGDYAEFELVSRMRSKPFGSLRSLLKDVPLYEIVSNIQELIHCNKKQGIGFLHDSILNLSNTNAPRFSNFFSSSDDRLAYLSIPLNILYANGTVGQSANLPILAAQLLHSSFATYPLFALAFEEEDLKIAPWRLVETINMSGQTPARFFGSVLYDWLARVS
jgi:hypothetical protein